MSTSDFSSRIHTDQDLIDRLEKSSWRDTWALTKSKMKLTGLAVSAGAACAGLVYFILINADSVLSGNQNFLTALLGAVASICVFGSLMTLTLNIIPSWLSFGCFALKKKSIVKRFSSALTNNTLNAVGYLDNVTNLLGIQDVADLARVPKETLAAMAQDQDIQSLCVSQWGANWIDQPLRKINTDWLATKIPDLDGKIKSAQQYLEDRAHEPTVDTFVLIPDLAPSVATPLSEKAKVMER